MNAIIFFAIDGVLLSYSSGNLAILMSLLNHAIYIYKCLMQVDQFGSILGLFAFDMHLLLFTLVPTSPILHELPWYLCILRTFDQSKENSDHMDTFKKYFTLTREM